MATDLQPHYRLLQLVSPSLPTGAFSYSQGLEWAVECGWVKDREDVGNWLRSLLYSAFQELEIPVFKKLYTAAEQENLELFGYWCDYLVASRETSELREEESNRGRALARLLPELGIQVTEPWLREVARCQSAGFALAAVKWNIACEEAALGYVWGWLENLTMAAVKLVPLGQTAGQQILAGAGGECCRMIEAGLNLSDEKIAGSCPAYAIAASLHETQYTRLFRS